MNSRVQTIKEKSRLSIKTITYVFSYYSESSAGVHKKLKLIKIDDKSKGKYKVVVEGKACRFERTIEVKVIGKHSKRYISYF